MKSIFTSALLLSLSLVMAGCNGFAPSSFVSDEELPGEVVEDTLPSEPVVIDSELLQATDDFFAVLAEGETAAYEATHEIFKVYTNEEDFSAFMNEFPVFLDHDSYEFYDFTIDGNEAFMSGLMESEVHGSYEINFLFDRNAEGAWEISGFDILLL